jgi:hypothetical protein
MNSQILTPKHANPPDVGGSPRDGRHPIRPPATESTLKQIGTEPICFPGSPKSDLGSYTDELAVLTPKRTTVRAPQTPRGDDKNPVPRTSCKLQRNKPLYLAVLQSRASRWNPPKSRSWPSTRKAHQQIKRPANRYIRPANRYVETRARGFGGSLNRQDCPALAAQLASSPGRAGWGREPARESDQ